MADKAKGSMNISISELSQTIDLKSYLGRNPTESEKSAFASMAQETIETRTLDGDDINGSEFHKYTKEYADLKGVTRDSVDLFLDGDMLDGIGRRKSKERVGTVFIQMKKGLQTKKGFNHNTGDGKGIPVREFFGITDAEAKRIAESVKEDIQQEETLTLGTLRALIDTLDVEQTE